MYMVTKRGKALTLKLDAYKRNNNKITLHFNNENGLENNEVVFDF